MDNRALFEGCEFSDGFPPEIVDAHAKYLTGKWFRWRLTDGDRLIAVADLERQRDRWHVD